MPIFISYSHSDSKFATRLAHQLVKRRANVWIDQWELHVGDSLTQKVQEAIEGATALLVILSEASVESEWCKKELSSGLIRELDEKRVIVLPVLMEDCKIPMFLRDKKYADLILNQLPKSRRPKFQKAPEPVKSIQNLSKFRYRPRSGRACCRQ